MSQSPKAKREGKNLLSKRIEAVKTTLEFKAFAEDCKPHDMRLCYVYSDTIPKAQAHIAQYDAHEAEHGFTGWHSLDRGKELSYDDTEGLRWAHLPLPSEYADVYPEEPEGWENPFGESLENNV